MKIFCAKVLAAGFLLLGSIGSLYAEEDTREWLEINVEVPGSLGAEILYKVDKLADVKYLRVNGDINSEDWVTIQNCSSKIALDLSGTSATAVPADEFYTGATQMTEIQLPANVRTIGYRAFYNSKIKEIYFPASVQSINYIYSNGYYGAFQNSALEKIVFDENCAINVIQNHTFYSCRSLKEVVLPESITSIDDYAFGNCTELESINMPASLQSIGNYAFNSTTKLTDVIFPYGLQSLGSNAFNQSGLKSIILPATVTSLGSYAFSSCQSATELVLPVAITNYANNEFNYCSAITKITCPCAVPPTVNSNAFYNVPASASLVVPSFALVDYKLDSYWLRYTNVSGGATSSFWNIGSKSLSLTGDRRFDDTPSLTIEPGGRLTIGGASAFPLDKLTLNSNMSYGYDANCSQIMNSCPAVSANEIETNINFNSGYWYFITLPYDVRKSDIRVSDWTASYALRYYNGSNRAATGGTGWTNVDEDGTMVAGQGYIIYLSKQCTVTFPASGVDSKLFDPNARVVILEENASDNASNAGWNLVGNPWMTYYDMYYSMLTCPVTLWDYNNRTYTAYSLIDDNVILKPYQAFFVQSTDELTEIEFGTKGRQFVSTVQRSASSPAREGSQTGRALFNLKLQGDEYADATRVVLNEDASLDYEPTCDASKFFSDNAAVPQLYTVDADGTQLAINERPVDNGEVALGYYAPAAGKMTLAATRIDGTAILVDHVANKSINLGDNSSYEFEASNAGYDNSRFSLKVGYINTGITSANSEQEFEVSVNGNLMTVYNASNPVYVNAADGRTVAVGSAAGEVSFELEAGVYVITSGDKSYKCVIR